VERVSAARAELRTADARRAEQSEQVSSARASVEAARAEISRLEESFRRAGESVEVATSKYQSALKERDVFRTTERPDVDDEQRQVLAENVDKVATEEVDARIGWEALRQSVRVSAGSSAGGPKPEKLRKKQHRLGKSQNIANGWQKRDARKRCWKSCQESCA